MRRIFQLEKHDCSGQLSEASLETCTAGERVVSARSKYESMPVKDLSEQFVVFLV